MSLSHDSFTIHRTGTISSGIIGRSFISMLFSFDKRSLFLFIISFSKLFVFFFSHSSRIFFPIIRYTSSFFHPSISFRNIFFSVSLLDDPK